MANGRWHPPKCKVCGVTEEEVGISATGLCPEHSKQRFEANVMQLIEHRGPFFDHWRARCLAAFGVVLPDE